MRIDEHAQGADSNRMEKRCSSIAVSSHSEGMSEDKVQEFLDPKNQRHRFSTMRKSPTPQTELKNRLVIEALDNGGSSPVKSGVINKNEDKTSNEILKENKKFEVDLKEQIKLHQAEQETENNTDIGLNSGNHKTAAEANLK